MADVPSSYLYIPHDSPIRFLTLFFLIPEELIARCPTLRKLPRSMSGITKCADVLSTESFIQEIIDAVGLMVFPHFGFGGWKEHYTGYFPVWKLCYATFVWVELVERLSDFGLQYLFHTKPGTYIPYMDPEKVNELFAVVVETAIREMGWQPMLELLHEMPCHEDFEPVDSNVRKDFLRKWYHTRSKRVQMISLEQTVSEEGEDSPIFYVPDPSQGIEDYVTEKDQAQRFLATLSEKDRQIVRLRYMGYTYEEIGKKLDYKNHSGVIKRIQAIKKKYTAFRRTD